MNSIGIVNYGMGNLTSVANAIRFAGFEPVILNHASELTTCEKLILPGVGAFAMAMKNLEEGHWTEALNEAVLVQKKPVLGLCLGMQLLFESSEEHGIHKGLGYIPGTVKSISAENIPFPVPHMGWNNLKFTGQSPLTESIDPEQNDVYFVHSFYCKCADPSDSIAVTDYGIEMDVMVQRGQLFGCQFHPEKSQSVGIAMLTNFCKL